MTTPPNSESTPSDAEIERAVKTIQKWHDQRIASYRITCESALLYLKAKRELQKANDIIHTGTPAEIRRLEGALKEVKDMLLYHKEEESHAKEQLLACQKACAEMREVLELAKTEPHYGVQSTCTLCKAIVHALSSNAGEGYVPKADIARAYNDGFIHGRMEASEHLTSALEICRTAKSFHAMVEGESPQLLEDDCNAIKFEETLTNHQQKYPEDNL